MNRDPVFWTIALFNASLLAVLFVATLREPGQHDGGREMVLFFYVGVPAVVLVGAVLLHALVGSAVARNVALFIVVVPGLLFAGRAVNGLWIDHRIAERRAGSGWFEGDAMRAMGRAVVRRDVAEVRRLGATVDIDAVGNDGMTLMRLAVTREPSTSADADALRVVQALIALGARPDPALPTAVLSGDEVLLDVVLDAGASPNVPSVAGQPEVFDWIGVMTVRTLRLLVKHGLDPDLRAYGSPLAVAVTIHRRWDLLAVLIDAGANVHCARDDGRNVTAELARQAAAEGADGRVVPADLLRAIASSRTRPAVCRDDRRSP